MMRRKKRRKNRINRKTNLIVAALVLALLVIVASGIVLWRMGKFQKSPGENTGETAEMPELKLEERMDASYEYWLAAAALTGISIEYPDFESASFYISGESALEEKMSSDGIFITFTYEDEEKCIFSTPLEAEREKTGTKDIYSEVIGFATFDEEEPDAVPKDYKSVQIEEINDLITQSTRVAVYTH